MRKLVLMSLAVLGIFAGCETPPGRDNGPTPLRPTIGGRGDERAAYPTTKPTGPATARLLGGGEPRPLGPIDPSVQRESPQIGPAATGAKGKLKLADGDQILRRTGQVKLEKATARRLFIFTPPTDQSQQVLPAMEILPGGMLDQIELAITEAKDVGVIFHITGEVTRYHGRWYLLIRKALVELTEGSEKAAP